MSNFNKITSWKKFKEEFFKAFKGKSKRAIYHTLLQMEKRKDETILEFFSRLEKLSPQDHQFRNNELLNAFIFGLPHEIKRHMLTKDFATVEEAKNYAVSKEIPISKDNSKEKNENHPKKLRKVEQKEKRALWKRKLPKKRKPKKKKIPTKKLLSSTTTTLQQK